MNTKYLLATPLELDISTTPGIFKRTKNGWFRAFDKPWHISRAYQLSDNWRVYYIRSYHSVKYLRRYYFIKYLTKKEVLVELL